MGHKEDIGKLIKKKLSGAGASPDARVWSRIDRSLYRQALTKKMILLLLWTAGIALLAVWFFGSPGSGPEDGESNVSGTETVQPPEEEEVLNPERHTPPRLPAGRPGHSDGEQQVVDRERGQRARTPLMPGDKQAADRESGQQSHTPFMPSDAQSGQDMSVRSGKREATAATQSQGHVPVLAENSKDHMAAVAADVGKTHSDPEDKEPDEEPEKAQEENPDNGSAEKTEELLSENEDERARWSITAVTYPAFYGSFGSGSLIDPRLEGYQKQGVVDLNYGISGNFYLTERFGMSLGVHKATHSYKTRDIPSSTEEEHLFIVSLWGLSPNTFNIADFYDFTENDDRIALLQKIEYIELPLEFSYRFLYHNRLGARAQAGFSTYVLTGDRIYAENTDGQLMEIGRANNLLSLKTSLNLGMGVYYELSDRISAEALPLFKYHLKTSDSKLFHSRNYQLGLFIGLTYRIE